MSGALSLRPSYYKALKSLTLELAGVKLGADHTFLIETRLSALARKEGYENISKMIDELFSQGQTRLAIHIVSALLERANSFFDDRESFNILRDKKSHIAFGYGIHHCIGAALARMEMRILFEELFKRIKGKKLSTPEPIQFMRSNRHQIVEQMKIQISNQ